MLTFRHLSAKVCSCRHFQDAFVAELELSEIHCMVTDRQKHAHIDTRKCCNNHPCFEWQGLIIYNKIKMTNSGITHIFIIPFSYRWDIILTIGIGEEKSTVWSKGEMVSVGDAHTGLCWYDTIGDTQVWDGVGGRVGVVTWSYDGKGYVNACIPPCGETWVMLSGVIGVWGVIGKTCIEYRCKINVQ